MIIKNVDMLYVVLHIIACEASNMAVLLACQASNMAVLLFPILVGKDEEEEDQSW